MHSVMSLLTSGMVFLLVMSVQLVEFVLLSVHNRVTGRGLSPRRLAPMLGAGVGLAWAALAASNGGAPWQIAAALVLALAAHLVDLAVRWRQQAGHQADVQH